VDDALEKDDDEEEREERCAPGLPRRFHSSPLDCEISALVISLLSRLDVRLLWTFVCCLTFSSDGEVVARTRRVV
jgi:hypothetical protein